MQVTEEIMQSYDDPNGSTLLKIPSDSFLEHNMNALHKHEWSDKKVESLNKKRQMYKCHE